MLFCYCCYMSDTAQPTMLVAAAWVLLVPFKQQGKVGQKRVEFCAIIAAACLVLPCMQQHKVEESLVRHEETAAFCRTPNIL